ncbi:MAG: hypothetical protein GXN98_00095, partial [Euryarchaeota archaeon]|nr:hypothetical protein [Euryarchaeota archaeon]
MTSGDFGKILVGAAIREIAGRLNKKCSIWSIESRLPDKFANWLKENGKYYAVRYKLIKINNDKKEFENT